MNRVIKPLKTKTNNYLINLTINKFISFEGYVDLVKGKDNIRIGYIPEKPQWGIMIKPSLENEGGYGYSYNLDGNTGKVLNKSKTIPFK